MQCISRMMLSTRFHNATPSRHITMLARCSINHQPRASFAILNAYRRNIHSSPFLLSEQLDSKSESSHVTTSNRVKYTCESYPQVERVRHFKTLDRGDVAFFKETLQSDASVIDGLTNDATDDLEAFNSDWMRKYRGKTQCVLKPASTKEVSAILRYCNEKSLAITPQGGNTGLVGGSVPVFDEVVINLSRMNSIKSFDNISGVLVADAGVILEAADEFLKERGYLFPLDLGAKGSCQIGGNVATNAGGLRLLRYGSLHGSVLGLEMVLPDGTIVNDLSTLRKNNTGYDLKQLFIGGEGTIGIITGISIQCPQLPTATNVAYFALPSYEHVQRAFKEAKSHLGEILSAFELMDGASQELYHKATGALLPLEGESPFYCLVETSGSNGEHDSAKLNSFLEYVMEKEIVSDGVMAENESQIASLWACREGISEASQHFGGVYKYDLSIALPELYDLVVEAREMFAQNGMMGDSDDFPVLDVVGYGHMGDSNLHLNVAVRRYDKDVEKALEPWVYEWVSRREGSISAEHGIGFAKKDYLHYSRSEEMIYLMKQIKHLYDPKGIMNPYKYI